MQDVQTDYLGTVKSILGSVVQSSDKAETGLPPNLIITYLHTYVDICQIYEQLFLDTH